MKLQGTMAINEKGHLVIGERDCVELAQEFGTPLYVVDERAFRLNCRDYFHAFTEKYGGTVVYAGKTLLTLAICRIIDEEGLSLDVVSGGELYTAYKAGFPLSRIYFHGNNKSRQEIELALELKIGRFMADNLYELAMLDEMACKMGSKADVLLRLTPGVEAHTHEYIRTGQIDSKFGLAIENGAAMEAVRQCLQYDNINLHGFHCHIGSQIFELESYEHAAEVMMKFVREVKETTGFITRELNLGGGLGIYYQKDDSPQPVALYADIIMNKIEELANSYGLPVPKIIVEPGRSISGTAGTTLYTVGAVKDIPRIRKYVAVDGGMGDNPRPALYQSKYEACLAGAAGAEPVETVSIAGKCCESGDMLIWDVDLPRVASGDILAVSCTGAYNYSMSSNYNRLPRPAMVLVAGGQADLIVERETYSDLIRNDRIPERLKKSLPFTTQCRA